MGHPGLMIVAIDNGGDMSIYGGPVSSFFDFEVGLSDRMTDEQWYEQVEGDATPARHSLRATGWSEIVNLS